MPEKTEQPTEKKKREAREKGQVARSRALSSTASGFFGLLAASSVLSGSAKTLVHYARSALLAGLARDQGPAQALVAALQMLAILSGPPLAAALAGAVLGSTVQVGLQLNLQAAAPSLERLDPSKNLARIFSLRSLVEVGRSLVAVAAVGWIAWSGLRSRAADLGQLPRLEGAGAMTLGLEMVRQIAIKAVLALLALSGLDFLYQRHAHQRDLMMTKEEVKQEHKNAEGDPHHKAKRKRMHKELLAAAGLRGVKGATAVVVNPTHVAVALFYEEKRYPTPVVAARGVDDEAHRIRLEARRLGVPIVKDIPLARALVQLEVGEEVPEELYQAVAGVLKVVFESKNEEVQP